MFMGTSDRLEMFGLKLVYHVFWGERLQAVVWDPYKASETKKQMEATQREQKRKAFWQSSGPEFERRGNKMDNWVVVSHIFYVHLYLGKWSNLTNIFQMGWNHQPDKDIGSVLIHHVFVGPLGETRQWVAAGIPESL